MAYHFCVCQPVAEPLHREALQGTSCLHILLPPAGRFEGQQGHGRSLPAAPSLPGTHVCLLCCKDMTWTAQRGTADCIPSMHSSEHLPAPLQPPVKVTHPTGHCLRHLDPLPATLLTLQLFMVAFPPAGGCDGHQRGPAGPGAWPSGRPARLQDGPVRAGGRLRHAASRWRLRRQWRQWWRPQAEDCCRAAGACQCRARRRCRWAAAF